jgi:hypothetical protein
MKTTIQLELGRLLDHAEFQTRYSHQIAADNQLHSQLLNYYGLNRFGTGKWFSLSPTHLHIFHQKQHYHHYHKDNEQFRTYQVNAYSLPRSPQIEGFILNLAQADAFFAQQLEQLGTVFGSTAYGQKHLFDKIQTTHPGLLAQLSITDHQKASARISRANACFISWPSMLAAGRIQERIFIGLDPQPGLPANRLPANRLPANRLPANGLSDKLPYNLPYQGSVDDHPLRSEYIPMHSLIIGVTHTFAPYGSTDGNTAASIAGSTVSERDLSEFFNGYTINSQPAFALSLPLLPCQYQLWKQLLPEWFYYQPKDRGPKARFHFYHQALATDIVSEQVGGILDKAIAFNYSLDRITTEQNKHILNTEPVNTRISTLTWSDGTTDKNVYLAEDKTLTYPSQNIERFRLKTILTQLH